MRRAGLTSLLVLLVMLLNSSVSFADNQGWKFKPGENPNSEFHKRLPLPFEDDITKDQNVQSIKLTTEQKHEALVWGLSEQEEQRYVALMKNKSGLYYKDKDVSPVQVLGYNARNNEERIRYAKKAAKQEFQYLAKYLAFTTAYNEQAVILKEKLKLPVVRQFDTAPFSPYNYQPVALQSGDNLMLFVGTKTHVRSIVGPLLNALNKQANVHLNIYFVGKKVSKDAIQIWAKHQNLPLHLVQSGQLTLNIGNKKLDQLNTNRKLPILVLIRGGESHFLDISRF